MTAYAQDPNANNLNALAEFNPEFVVGQKQQQANQEQEALAKRVKMIGDAAQWADTPEKWDSAVGYLSQFYPELAQYRGQFSPETRMAAISAAGQMDAYLKQQAPVSLGPGTRLVNPTNGNVIAEAPFAPREFTLKPGETAYSAPRGSTDPASIFSRMIHTESRGNQFGADGKPLASSAGAIGIAQVMPGTAPEAAQLAGLPWDENRYRTDAAYNQALGKAYFEKQLADFGDPALAVAAYNAGPGRIRAALQKGGAAGWQNHIPGETKDYLNKVLGGGAQPIASGGPAPAEKPQAAPSGYRWKPDGSMEPIPGGPADKPENRPQSKEAYSQSAMDAFDRAIGTANRLLEHPGFSAAVGVKGLTGGLLGGWVVPGTDAADFRAELDAMKAQVFLPMVQSMKGMGALSNAEGEKLTASIGALDARMSEGAFKASLRRIIQDLNTYKARAAQPAPASRPDARPTGARPSVSNW